MSFYPVDRVPSGNVAPVPVFRPTARVLVVDRAGRVLLFGGQISGEGADGGGSRDRGVRTWFTPGGGVRAGESVEQAAVRELAEETGHLLAADELGPVVATCAGLWRAGPQVFFGVDTFYLVRVAALRMDGRGREQFERPALEVHRWWTAAELDLTADRVLPAGLAGLLHRLLAEGVPGRPARLPWRAFSARTY
jgi:8-oxo-dGTP pyrophosphatase MutT (NUDIX family)